MAELADQNAIIERFSELRREAQELSGRLSELSGDLQEHELVIKNLEPVDRDRRCYRLVFHIASVHVYELTIALQHLTLNRQQLERPLRG
jgi:hypothetical protein